MRVRRRLGRARLFHAPPHRHVVPASRGPPPVRSANTALHVDAGATSGCQARALLLRHDPSGFVFQGSGDAGSGSRWLASVSFLNLFSLSIDSHIVCRHNR